MRLCQKGEPGHEQVQDEDSAGNEVAPDSRQARELIVDRVEIGKGVEPEDDEVEAFAEVEMAHVPDRERDRISYLRWLVEQALLRSLDHRPTGVNAGDAEPLLLLHAPRRQRQRDPARATRQFQHPLRPVPIEHAKPQAEVEILLIELQLVEPHVIPHRPSSLLRPVRSWLETVPGGIGSAFRSCQVAAMLHRHCLDRVPLTAVSGPAGM